VSQNADMIFVNGAVVTVDAHGTVAEALAVTGNTITAVGSRAEIEGHAGPSTRVVDLDGGTLLPGINDSHIHAISLGYMTPPLNLDVGYPAVQSIADVAQMVRDAAAGRPAGEWIVGQGWDVGYLAECAADPDRLLTRHDLDAAAPDHPVLLIDFSYHTAWVNTAVLQRVGLDPDGDHTHDEAVVTHPDGTPTGVLFERWQRAALELVPPMTDEQRETAARLVMRQLNSLGITSITDPALGPADPVGPMSAEGIGVYRRLLEQGELTLRVNVLRFPSGMSPSLDEFRRGLEQLGAVSTPDPRRFDVVGVKIFADGIPPNKTAWMYDEYEGGGHGALTVVGDTDAQRVADLHEMVRIGHDLGYQVGVHVTGDRSADEVVKAFVEACEANPRPDPRHYLIHADFVTPWAIQTCSRFGFGVNMNPTIKWTIAHLVSDFVGAERGAYEWPYRDTIDGGVTTCSSSDGPVTLPDWRQGVATMVLREAKADGVVSGPEQRITLLEALRTYTINAAWQDRAEAWKGSLEVGKVADLCVLAGDLLGADPHDIPSIPVRMTVLDGAPVYERDGDPIGAAPGLAHGPVAGHYGPSTRLVMRPHGCGCGYDRLVVSAH
jgi:predicted amidohydrolase YtcJ